MKLQGVSITRASLFYQKDGKVLKSLKFSKKVEKTEIFQKFGAGKGCTEFWFRVKLSF